MDFTQFAKSRKSARGFLDKPVPKEVVDEIIEAAKWAPSSYNTQTWRVHAVTGDVLDKIRKGNTENTLAGKPHVRDFPYKEEYELSLIHISEPTRRTPISYAVFCLKKKK